MNMRYTKIAMHANHFSAAISACVINFSREFWYENNAYLIADSSERN